MLEAQQMINTAINNLISDVPDIIQLISDISEWIEEHKNDLSDFIELRNEQIELFKEEYNVKMEEIDNALYDSADFNGHEYVDLGLPSGTLWATKNIGSENPSLKGKLYLWEDSEDKEEYRLNNWQLPHNSLGHLTNYLDYNNINYLTLY